MEQISARTEPSRYVEYREALHPIIKNLLSRWATSPWLPSLHVSSYSRRPAQLGSECQGLTAICRAPRTARVRVTCRRLKKSVPRPKGFPLRCPKDPQLQTDLTLPNAMPYGSA